MAGAAARPNADSINALVFAYGPRLHIGASRLRTRATFDRPANVRASRNL